MKVLNKEKDLANKWRVWVQISEGDEPEEVIMLKFDSNPSNAKINEVAQSLKESIITRKAKEKELKELQQRIKELKKELNIDATSE